MDNTTLIKVVRLSQSFYYSFPATPMMVLHVMKPVKSDQSIIFNNLIN